MGTWTIVQKRFRMFRAALRQPISLTRHLLIGALSLLIGFSGALLLRAAGGQRIEAIVTLHVVEGLRWVGLDCCYGPENLLRAELLFLLLSTLALSVMPYLLLRWTLHRPPAEA